MASNLEYVLDNFYWHIEAITPAYSGLARAVNRFREWDPHDGSDPHQGSGWTRRFWCEWLGSDEDNNSTSDPLREADHVYAVHVLYAVGKHRRTQAIVTSDRHDLIKRLRGEIGTDYRLGYNDANSTTDIGLMKRWRAEDTLRPYEDNQKLLLLSMEWICSVRENET